MRAGSGEVLLLVACLAAGCAAPPPQSTGGVSVVAGPFGRGVLVIDTNYESSNVSLLGVDGAVLSTSFLSTTNSQLSSDVAAPSMPVVGDDIVVLDRTFGIVTWANVKTANVRAQFHVDGDDLAKNPWDYLPISPEKAYVTRYDRVPGAGLHGDVIVVNPTTATVLSPVEKRIPIADKLALPKGEYAVHPARGVIIGDRAYLTTVIATLDYEYSDSFVVVIDTKTDEIVAEKKLEGLHDCTGIAASPDGEELAVSCSGDLQADGDPSLTTAGVVLLNREDLSMNKLYPASALGGGVPAFSLSYADNRALLLPLLGNVKNDLDDVAVAIDLDTGETREIHRAGPVQIGAVLCPTRLDGDPGGATPEACFITDADASTVLRFPVKEGLFSDPKSTLVDDQRGRPPRYLGQF